MPGFDLVNRVAGQAREALPGTARRRVAPVDRVEVEAARVGVVRAYEATSRWAALVAVFVGYHALIGWVFDVPAFRSPGPGAPAMTVTSALAVVVSAASLLGLHAWRRSEAFGKEPPLGPRTGATFVSALATTALLEHVSRISLRLHVLGGSDPSMHLASAIAFLAIGLALLVLGGPWDRGGPAILGLLGGAFALESLVGYGFGAPPSGARMPLYTAVAAFGVSVAIVCFRVDQGFMRKVASASVGGVLARQLLPATLLAPIVLGWLVLVGLHAGWYSVARGIALYSVVNVAVTVAVVWRGVTSLYRMDTRRLQAERELEETAARLRRSNADLEQFAYVASHDLKEPLRAISGSIQVLQARLDEGARAIDVDDVLRHTVDGANRMQTLIDDLLTYSRLISREAPIEPTSSQEVLGEALANLEVLVRENRAVVTADLLPVVRADRTQLLQVFQNLISNAVKYRSERTPKIHVGVEDKGVEWVFSVRDNGIGIAPQYTERIFKIFQRLHTRRDYPGTGIGLAVCKKVVERHGGRIWVESEPEEGSTFSFTLPK